MNGLHFFTVSSLEKVRIKKRPKLFETEGTALLGERYSFQVVSYLEHTEGSYEVYGANICIDLPEGVTATVRQVEQVAVTCAHNGNKDYYLSVGDEILPDILAPISEKPIRNGGSIMLRYGMNQTFWITVENAPAGVHTVGVRMTYKGQTLAETSYTLTVLDAPLPKTDLFYTNWMHYDSISNYYGVPVWSDRFRELTDAYILSSVRHGMTCLYIPLVTPPLDTEVGGERKTVQLLDITVNDGSYSFDFDRTVAFMKRALELGIEHFEMSHLYTQWGLAAAPKVVAAVDGEERRIFGWDTPSSGEEYTAFLRALLPELRKRLISEGLYSRCLWHISDEPTAPHIERYRFCRTLVRELMPDAEVLDALSHYEFFEYGLVDRPIVALTAVKEFMEKNAVGYGVYYCTGQDTDYISNRFIAMASERTRIIGMQLYLNGIKSFLHWGFNFWNSGHSLSPIDPYRTNDALGWFESGDPFIVYPGKDGPVDSIRHELMSDALSDYRALLALESKIGRVETCKLLLDAGMAKNFNTYPHSATWLKSTREEINRRIAEA